MDIDALKNLTALQSLSLIACDNIPAAALPKTIITFPDGTRSPTQ